jgi:hypothetical protein
MYHFLFFVPPVFSELPLFIINDVAIVSVLELELLGEGGGGRGLEHSVG